VRPYFISDMKLLTLGMCQLHSIMLVSPSLRSCDWEYLHIRDTPSSEIQSKVSSADIIITHPTSYWFRHDHALATENILRLLKPSALMVLMPTLDCPFYYFDVGHIYVEGRTINQPSHLHYKGLYETHLTGGGEEEFIRDCVQNVSYCRDIEKVCSDYFDLQSKHEDRARSFSGPNCVPLIVSDLIRSNYKDTLLSYTANHPTKELIQLVAERLHKLIGADWLTIDKNADPFAGDGVQDILYASIAEHVSFDTAKHPFRTQTPYDDPTFSGVINWYLRSYDSVANYYVT